MTDKERILIYLVDRIFMGALYSPDSVRKWREDQPGIFKHDKRLMPGDLVAGMSAITPNEFLVGYVDKVLPECVVIREIGSKRLCNYYNERFMRIDKSMLGYEILEGMQYATYQKVLKAFSRSNNSYGIRFQSIEFEGKTCIVNARQVFSDETVYTVRFSYNSKTSIKSVVERLNDAASKSVIVSDIHSGYALHA